MVYEKSSLGYNEFASNIRTLNVRERQVLLLINGERNLDDLEKLFKKEVLSDAIKKLATHGYIQLTSTNQATVTHPLPSITPLPPATTISPQTATSFFEMIEPAEAICPSKMLKIKTILLEASDNYLGIMGKNIKAKIDACDNEKDLRQCISGWHMAMRESKLGRESVSFLMEEINQSLENKTVSVAPSNSTH